MMTRLGEEEEMKRCAWRIRLFGKGQGFLAWLRSGSLMQIKKVKVKKGLEKIRIRFV